MNIRVTRFSCSGSYETGLQISKLKVYVAKITNETGLQISKLKVYVAKITNETGLQISKLKVYVAKITNSRENSNSNRTVDVDKVIVSAGTPAFNKLCSSAQSAILPTNPVI